MCKEKLKNNNFRHPKMTIEEMNIIVNKCKSLGIDPEPYMSVQYAGKLIFDLSWLELCTKKIVLPNPEDYKAGGKYDYNK